MEGYQSAVLSPCCTRSEVQFANTINSHVNIPHICFNYSNHGYENHIVQPMSNNMHAFNINDASSDTNHVYMLSHTSALPQSQMPMYNQQGQTNIMSSTNFYEASRHNNFANMHQEFHILVHQ